MSKIILITGTRKGIGKFLAQHFLDKGHIVCGCSRKEGSISHQNYRHFSLDISDEKAVASMLRQIKLEFQGIDVLLNNAGIAAMNHCLTTPFKSLESVFKTNVFGSFLLLREVAKLMSINYKKQARPYPYRIVNFSTVASALRLEGEAVYAASKAAIINLSQTCAKELAPFGITVNVVAPTPIQTDLIKNIPQQKIDELLEKQAIKRLGKFEDVLNVINFFLDEKSEFITAQTVFLGGVYE